MVPLKKRNIPGDVHRHLVYWSKNLDVQLSTLLIQLWCFQLHEISHDMKKKKGFETLVKWKKHSE